ncbi:MAG TPA: IclR family transcriptional regulator [Gemmobacter sp.]|nr:IclR family transcriptional regulator [Gemmobacter sp.]
MAAAIDRILAALSLLSTQPEGMSVQALAHALDMPASAAHRLLNDLVRLDFATQPQPQGNYALTLRLAALGLGYLGAAGITDIAAPVLDGLARTSGELVRLSVVDGDALIWVAAAQGATSGLRYDPAREQGAHAPLAHSASGRAWAATLPEDRALRLIAAQPAEPPPGARPQPAPDLARLQQMLAQIRAQGHAEAEDSFLEGMAAIAVPLPGSPCLGCLSIAGPGVRLTVARRAALLPALHTAARELAGLTQALAWFRMRRA